MIRNETCFLQGFAVFSGGNAQLAFEDSAKVRQGGKAALLGAFLQGKEGMLHQGHGVLDAKGIQIF